jgi:putative nucleotidyltransferase with HDIG domain
MKPEDHLRITAVIEFVENTIALIFSEDGHLIRCEKLAYDLAIELGVSFEEIVLLKYATRLHDIGKLGIPEHILSRKKLTKAEMDMIRGHPARGVGLLKNMQFDQRIVEAINYHHEWWNGGGYPNGLRGEEIPLFSRIIGIVDAFDGITSERVYHPIRSITEALKIMETEAGKKSDPVIFKVFKKMMTRG